MSTRALIAIPVPVGLFEGRYHHTCGDPTGLGRSLWHLCRDHFEGCVASMVRTLVYDHEAWSCIVDADWSRPIGYVQYEKRGDFPWPPMCYCHGERSEGPFPLVKASKTGIDLEWAYVLGEAMTVYAATYETPSYELGETEQAEVRWREVAVVDWAVEPNWAELEKA